MMSFFREPMKSRKDAPTGGIVSAYHFLLIKSTTELLVVLAEFHTDNELFQHCLLMHILKLMNQLVGQFQTWKRLTQ